jgi:hypothetical protein
MELTYREFLDAFDAWASVSFDTPEIRSFERDVLKAEYARLRASWLERFDVDDATRRAVDAMCEASQAMAPTTPSGGFGVFGLRIRKSNLLYRLLYRREQLRTVACPAHKGHWAGYDSQFEGERDYAVCECQYLESGHWALDVTGWLPVNIEELRRAGRVAVRPRSDVR